MRRSGQAANLGVALHIANVYRTSSEAPLFITFPEDAHWNAEHQAVEFGVEIGEYRGFVRVSRRVFQRLLPERPNPRALRRGVLPPADAVRKRR